MHAVGAEIPGRVSVAVARIIPNIAKGHRDAIPDSIVNLAFPIWDASGEIIDETPVVQPCFRTQSCAQGGVRAC